MSSGGHKTTFSTLLVDSLHFIMVMMREKCMKLVFSLDHFLSDFFFIPLMTTTKVFSFSSSFLRQLSRYRRLPTKRAGRRDVMTSTGFLFSFFFEAHVFAHPDLFSNCFGRKYKELSSLHAARLFSSLVCEPRIQLKASLGLFTLLSSFRRRKKNFKVPPRSFVMVFALHNSFQVVECD